MVIMKTTFVIIVLALPIYMIFKMVKMLRTHNSLKRNLDGFTKLNETLLAYISEIKDMSVRVEYTQYISEFITNYRANLTRFSKEGESYFKTEIYNKFGKNIPSLQKEVRDKLLTEILD